MLTKRMSEDLRARLEREAEEARLENRERRLIELAPDLVAEAKAHVERQLVIGTGDYTLCVRAHGWKKDKPVAEVRCQMTLFETDMSDLLADMEDYKYGAGWTHPTTQTKWINVAIRAST